MSDHDYKKLGLSPEKWQKQDTEAKKLLLREWMMARIFAWLFDEYSGLSPEKTAPYLRNQDSEYTSYINEDGTIHPGAVIEGLQQEFAEENAGKSVLDVFTKAKVPGSDKPIQVYMEANGYHLTEEQLKYRAFLYMVRIVSKQLEGPLTTSKPDLYEKVKGVWFMTGSNGKNRGKIFRNFIAREELTADAQTHKITDAGIAEWFEVYVGDATEEEAGKFAPQTDLEKLTDLLEISMTDKIESDKKPDLLHGLFDVNIDGVLKGDIDAMTAWESFVNEFSRTVDENNALRADAAAKDAIIADQNAVIADKDTEIETLKANSDVKDAIIKDLLEKLEKKNS